MLTQSRNAIEQCAGAMRRRSTVSEVYRRRGPLRGGLFGRPLCRRCRRHTQDSGSASRADRSTLKQTRLPDGRATVLADEFGATKAAPTPAPSNAPSSKRGCQPTRAGQVASADEPMTSITITPRTTALRVPRCSGVRQANALSHNAGSMASARQARRMGRYRSTALQETTRCAWTRESWLQEAGHAACHARFPRPRQARFLKSVDRVPAHTPSPALHWPITPGIVA